MRPSATAALCAAALVGVPLLAAPALAGPGDKKAEKAERRRKAEEAARRAERERLVAHWSERLRGDDPVLRLQGAWNLRALLPESEPRLLELLKERPQAPRRGEVDPRRYEAIVEVCGVVGEARLVGAIPALKELVADGGVPFTCRLAALVALAKLMDGESQAFLDEVARTQGDAPALRQAALLALGMIGAPTTGRVAEGLLADEDPMTRFAAFRAIGWSQDRRYVPRCVEGLNDENPLVASMAAKALGRIGDPATTDKLVEVARKTHWKQLWFFILEALGRLSHQPALDELLRLVQEPKFSAQTDAATFLYEVGERRSLPLFRRLLEESLKGKHQVGMDTITAFALGAMADSEAVPALLTALRKGRLDVRREAASALGLIGDPRAVDPLLEVVTGTPDRPLRVRALLALGRLGGVAAVRAVQQALRDREPAIRWAAVVALEARKDPALVPALQPLLRDEQPFVAEAARAAIGLLSGTPGIAPDPRREAILVRLRALEREMLLRLQLAGINPALPPGPLTPRPVIPPPPDPKDWGATVTVESYVSTCGGTHPPIEYRFEQTTFDDPAQREAYEKAKAAYETGKAQAEADWEAREKAARSRAVAAAGGWQRDRLDETYELKNLRGDGDRVRERSHDQGGNGAGGAGAGNGPGSDRPEGR